MLRLLRTAIAAAAVSTFLGCINLPPLGFSDDRGTLGIEVIEPAKGFLTTDEILLLPLSGLVTSGDAETGLGGDPGMLVALRDRLLAARKNPRLKAVLLRIDSPGGTVTASDLIYEEIVRFKKETKLPVIAQMTEVAASGGIYIAMAADEIYALPTTITGSIGVVAMYPQLGGALDKLGIGMNVIKAGAMKDAGSMWREMKPEERAVFQEIVDQYRSRFVSVIMASRADDGLTTAVLDRIADGRILTPQQAVEAHLIDGIKYPDDALARAKQKAGAMNAAVVSYEYPYHYRGHIYASSDAREPSAGGSAAPSFNMLSINGSALMREFAGARFFYLWTP